jgi:hypothetical protein
MTWINHATPSGFGGLVCLLAATCISPLRGYSLLGMTATSAPLGELQALNVFLIAPHVIVYLKKYRLIYDQPAFSIGLIHFAKIIRVNLPFSEARTSLFCFLHFL